jgi:predicted kinase
MATGQTTSGEDADLDHMSIRDKAKGLTKKRLKLYTEGRLGVIIDGTGHNYSKIAKQKGEMEKLGYDTYMVAVNTSLDVAKERNKDRRRALPEDILIKSWSDVQNNLGSFQSLFGASSFKIIDNSKFLKPEQAQKKFAKIMGDGVNKFVTKPVKNPIGKTWVKNQKN